MIVDLEHFCTRGWHSDCSVRHGSPMKRSSDPKDDLKLDDGSLLPLWTCMACGEQCHAGVRGSDRRIIQIPKDTP